mgnify:CR=1 FL=1
MSVIIKEQKKHPTQPTNTNTVWVLSYLPTEDKATDNIMGWISSGDTKQQLKIKFDTLKQAESYAKKQDLDYQIDPLDKSEERAPIVKSYLDIYR